MLVALQEHWGTDLRSGDPLGFPGYADKVATLDHESVHTGRADGFVLIEGDFDVIGGSMGLVHGEKVVRAFDRAIDARLPVVVVTRSGGARMQEGMVSLVQLARTAAAARRHGAAGLLSVSVHRPPTWLTLWSLPTSCWPGWRPRSARAPRLSTPTGRPRRCGRHPRAGRRARSRRGGPTHAHER